METKYFEEFRDVHSKAAGDVYSKAVSDRYSKAVREMYSQFKPKEAHPLEKYIGRLARCSWGGAFEVVGYAVMPEGFCSLIVGSHQGKGWTDLEPYDVVFKECRSYWYTSINNLKTEDYD